MKKTISTFLITTILMLTMLNGCSNPESTFNYDLLLQMPKIYVGEADNVIYESLEQFKEQTFSDKSVSGAIATIECVNNDFYITIRHDGEDIMFSGKTVSKCNVVTVGETFNNCSISRDSTVELVQDYYLFPLDENEIINMLESFGVNFIKNSAGTIIKAEIEDGDYLLQVKETNNYTLKICNDVLPMEPGKKYTGAIISSEPITAVMYLSPLENTQRYETFQMSESTTNIATAIKLDLTTSDMITYSSGDVLSQTVLNNAEKQIIINILNSDREWRSEIPACDWICRFSGSINVGYCDCGTLSDIGNNRSRKLTTEERELLENLISHYNADLSHSG